ncbi:MAG: GtrA family protein [Lachnospiraceae bacterium]|nr:GtrA family protein [Lachnospiraceae bacterium]
MEKKREEMDGGHSALRTSANPLIKLFFKLWDIFMTREVITYLISGVLTTLVNWVLYWLIVEKIGMEELSGNAVDWVLTVAFAYVVNAFWVFDSKFRGLKAEGKKILRFYAARLLTFAIEEGGILIFVKQLKFNGMLVKAVLAVIVIILNYVFSKLFVFLKKTE